MFTQGLSPLNYWLGSAFHVEDGCAENILQFCMSRMLSVTATLGKPHNWEGPQGYVLFVRPKGSSKSSGKDYTEGKQTTA